MVVQTTNSANISSYLDLKLTTSEEEYILPKGLWLIQPQYCQTGSEHAKIFLIVDTEGNSVLEWENTGGIANLINWFDYIVLNGAYYSFLPTYIYSDGVNYSIKNATDTGTPIFKVLCMKVA